MRGVLTGMNIEKDRVQYTLQNTVGMQPVLAPPQTVEIVKAEIEISGGNQPPEHEE